MKNKASYLTKFLMVGFVGVFLFSSSGEAMSPKPKAFPVVMKVDFGPAGKPAFSETIWVEKGTTPKEAVSQVFPVLSGASCCSLREVLAIDGVRVEADKKRWWICLLNGDKKKTSPHKTKLKKNDVVEWKYIETR